VDFELAFSGAVLDRVDHLRTDHEWLSLRMQDPSTSFLPVWRGKPLITFDDKGAHLGWVEPSRIAGLVAKDASVILLGTWQERAYFAIDATSIEQPRQRGPLVGRGKMIDARSIAPDLSPGDAAVLAQARSMLQWHHTHPFCARCGESTRLTVAGYKRVCTSCGADHFPRTDPVVIMAINHRNRCLLGRKPGFPPTLYTCLAGFIEPGESIENAVRREALEEAGVEVTDVRYLASQPWPFPSQLMIGLIGQASSDAIHLGPNELEDARWFDREEVLAAIAGQNASLRIPPALAIAHQLIRAWADEAGQSAG